MSDLKKIKSIQLSRLNNGSILFLFLTTLIFFFFYSNQAFSQRLEKIQDSLMHHCYGNPDYFVPNSSDTEALLSSDFIASNKKSFDSICDLFFSYEMAYNTIRYDYEFADIKSSVSDIDSSKLMKNDYLPIERIAIEYKKYDRENEKNSGLLGSFLIKSKGNREFFFNKNFLLNGINDSEEGLFLYDKIISLSKEDLEVVFGSPVFYNEQIKVVSEIYGELDGNIYEELLPGMINSNYYNKCSNEYFHRELASNGKREDESLTKEDIGRFTDVIYVSKYRTQENIRDSLLLWGEFIKSAIKFKKQNSSNGNFILDDIYDFLKSYEPSTFVKKDKDDYFIRMFYGELDETSLLTNNFDLNYIDLYDNLKIDGLYYSYDEVDSLDKKFRKVGDLISDMKDDFKGTVEKKYNEKTNFEKFIKERWPCNYDGLVFKFPCLVGLETKNKQVIPDNIDEALKISTDYFGVIYLKYLKDDIAKSGYKNNKFNFGIDMSCSIKGFNGFGDYLNLDSKMHKQLINTINKSFLSAQKKSLLAKEQFEFIAKEDYDSTIKYASKLIEINKQIDAVRIIRSRVDNENL